MTSLSAVLKGRVVIVGIGNPLRGDDGFGPALIDEINGRVNAVCLDVGSAPESYVGKIARENPETILLVDAVHLNQEPGSSMILRKEEIQKSGLTTHDLSPHLFIDHLERETKAQIYLLGVQPQAISFGSEMTEPVKKSLISLAAQLKEALHA